MRRADVRRKAPSGEWKPGRERFSARLAETEGGIPCVDVVATGGGRRCAGPWLIA